MHPASSVVFFTTASGAGYGLLALMGLCAAFDLLPADPWFGAIGLGLALALVTAGLLSSMLHLGHPERAWRAFSQWRSSWLSREGVSSVATYVPAVALAAGWILFRSTAGLWAVAGIASALMAGVTVYCTAMIYASLKPVPRWRNRWVVPGYFAMALSTGAVLLAALSAGYGLAAQWPPILAAVAAAVAGLGKWIYWREIAAAPAAASAESATGLGGFGRVRLLEAPHTEENYLLKEMGYRIARKHAAKLRTIALLTGFLLPAVLALASVALSHPATAFALLAVASLLALAGTFVERWLFFAEARHSVTLYYGAAAV